MCRRGKFLASPLKPGLNSLFPTWFPPRFGWPHSHGPPEHRGSQGAVLLWEDRVPQVRGQLQPAGALQLAPRPGGAAAGLRQGRGDLRAFLYPGRTEKATVTSEWSWGSWLDMGWAGALRAGLGAGWVWFTKIRVLVNTDTQLWEQKTL